MLSTVCINSSCTTHLISRPANSLWSETPAAEKSIKVWRYEHWNSCCDYSFYRLNKKACARVLTGIASAFPGVVTGHLAVSSLGERSVVAALWLSVEISILEMYRSDKIHHEHRHRLVSDIVETVCKGEFFSLVKSKVYEACAELLLCIVIV